MRASVRLVTTVLVGGAVLASCSSGGGSQDDLQATPTLTAATPAVSPQPAVSPSGTVVALPDGSASAVTAMVVDPGTHTLAVAVASPPSLLLYSLTDLQAQPTTVRLPGVVNNLALAKPGGPVLAPVTSANQVVEVTLPTGTTAVVPVAGGPTSATEVNGQLLVAVPGNKAVDVFTGDQLARTITGDVNPDQVVVAGGKVVLLDRIRSAVFDVDLGGGSVGAGLRAGNGATNAAVDGYGRVLVTDTRSGQLLAFSAGPVLLRQRGPVGGAPYGIVVDPNRDLAWVTATGLNQVIGYQLAGGQPAEKYRLPTVRQPNSVAVDPDSGRVFVASADGGGIQVLQP